MTNIIIMAYICHWYNAGSCVSEGYIGCCEDGDCRGGNVTNCYCDELCHQIGDCCDDIL